MTGKITTLEASDNLYVLGETLRPLLTNSMGSPIEIFDTRGPLNAGPPPHTHAWDEFYVVLEGALEVRMGDGAPQRLSKGDAVYIPAGTAHGYRNLSDDTHFLTIVTRGNADKFFHDVAANVEMNPPDIPEVVRVGANHGIHFV
jgi:mannose-6-phosphate isomerase-like protein (cupin superfamily)